MIVVHGYNNRDDDVVDDDGVDDADDDATLDANVSGELMVENGACM
jgi:hypothetical protein